VDVGASFGLLLLASEEAAPAAMSGRGGGITGVMLCDSGEAFTAVPQVKACVV